MRLLLKILEWFFYISKALPQRVICISKGINCKYDLRTFLSCYQGGFVWSPEVPLVNLVLTHNQKVGRSLRSRISVATTSQALCFALFTADSVIILIGALLSYLIVVLSGPFTLGLCFLPGFFLPYWQFVKICINLEFQACIMVSLCCVCLKLINDRTLCGVGLWRVLTQVLHIN